MSDTNASAAAPAAPAAAAPGADAAAAPAAPASAPAAPAVDDSASIGDAPVASDDSAAPSGDEVAAYEPTGDVGLDVALDFVGSRGIKPSHPAMIEAEKGNFAPLEALFATMGDKAKGYEKMIALAQQSFNNAKAAAETKAAEGAKMIHETVGGKENWLAIKTWAAANAEPEEKAAVNSALAKGGLEAKVMAQWLHNRFNAAAGTTVEPASVTQPNAGGKPPAVQHLTRQGFIKEADALRIKLGHAFEGSKEYAQLRARRSASARAGH